MKQIPFGEWLPDLPSYANPGATVANNVIPLGISYGQFLGQTVYSNALDARCQGAISTKDASGNTVNFAGNASKLYKSAAAVYSDVSLAGGYTTNPEENWHFTRFGDRLIATNFAENPQSFTLSSSANFANLTTAIKARYCATIRDFLVLGNTYDAVDGNVPHRVRWSAIGDPTDFTVSASTQSDFDDRNPSYGHVRQIIGGESGVVFQERAICRMTYVGSPVIWQFDEVEIGKGTQASYAAIKVGNIIPYLGIDGFYVFDGSQSVAIGSNKVDRTFFSELDASYLSRIYAVADFDRQIVYWLYPATGHSSGNGNKILAYNYSPNASMRWASASDLNLEFMYASISEGYTLDSLDSLSGSLDALPFSLDSRVYKGENYLLSGFDSNHKQVNFDGSAMTAMLETQEVQLFPSKRSYISRIRPLVDGSGTVTAQMGTRNLQSESVTYGSSASVGANGDCPVRSNARYQRVRVNISGGFTHAQGVEVVEASSAGSR